MQFVANKQSIETENLFGWVYDIRDSVPTSEFEREASVRRAVCFGPTFVPAGKCHAVSRPAEGMQLNDTSGLTFRNYNCKTVVSCQECASVTVELHEKTAALGVWRLRKWAAWLIFRRSHPTHFDVANGDSLFFWTVGKTAYFKSASVHQNRIKINNGENLKWIRKRI